MFPSSENKNETKFDSHVDPFWVWIYLISLVKFLTRQVNCVKVKSWDIHTLTYFIWEGITVKIWSVIVTLIYSDVNCGKWEKIYVRCLQRIILQIKLYCDSKSFRNLKNIIICVIRWNISIGYDKKIINAVVILAWY